MALQPAAGAKDLNPKQVELNHQLSIRLAEVYKQWGYEEVAPPRVERMATLKAGGAISSKEIVRIVSDEALGLRPEMTASIARAACTRFGERPRPLRLWAAGTVFESKSTVDGALCIEESLHSGVELFGLKNVSAELELLSLLVKSISKLKLGVNNKTQILIGHTDILDLILTQFNQCDKDTIRKYLAEFDRLSIENSHLKTNEKKYLNKILDTRGKPDSVIEEIKSMFGESKCLQDIRRLFNYIEPLASSQSISIQFDPTFLPHFDLYQGFVFQVVCHHSTAPVVIARGGRYDEIVSRCGASGNDAAGVGFSFAIDSIRELIGNESQDQTGIEKVLVAYGPGVSLEEALNRQHQWHNKGVMAIVEVNCCKNKNMASEMMLNRNCSTLDWIDL